MTLAIDSLLEWVLFCAAVTVTWMLLPYSPSP
jgi:hypothetical protein